MSRQCLFPRRSPAGLSAGHEYPAAQAGAAYSRQGGDEIEFGEVQTDKGWHQLYKTYYPHTLGIPSATVNTLAIFSEDATISDWAGLYGGGSIGYGYGSVDVGFSSSYKVIGVGIGWSWTPKGFKNKSGSLIVGRTVLIGVPFYKPYPYGPIQYSNSYISELYGN